jgi:hypothetical protein
MANQLGSKERDCAADRVVRSGLFPSRETVPPIRIDYEFGLTAQPVKLMVGGRSAMSSRLVRPIGIAPAARIRSTTGASVGTTAWANAGTPRWWVGLPCQYFPSP